MARAPGARKCWLECSSQHHESAVATRASMNVFDGVEDRSTGRGHLNFIPDGMSHERASDWRLVGELADCRIGLGAAHQREGATRATISLDVNSGAESYRALAPGVLWRFHYNR